MVVRITGWKCQYLIDERRVAATYRLLFATVALIPATMTDTLGRRAALEHLCIRTDEQRQYELHPVVDEEDCLAEGQQRLSLRRGTQRIPM